MSSYPDPGPVTSLIEAFRRSKTMFTAVELGVFDHLAEAAMSAVELSQRTACAPEPLERLLDGCCGLGLLNKVEGRYANTDAAAVYLTGASPHSLAGYALYSNRVLYPMWMHLKDAVRDGGHRWSQAFGLQGPIFSHFFQTIEAKQTFLDGMHGFGMISSPAVVRVFNLGRFRKIVDLGGATGHLAIAACERYGHLEGVVYDLPEVVEHARPFVEASRAGSRITLQPGDFFADPLPPTDLYACGRILHDWSEPKIQTLLAKIHSALPAGGGLLIVETLLDDDSCGPPWALMQSLNMLVCTEGRERTVDQYRSLLEQAGFVGVEGRRTGAPLDAILALKS